MIHSTTRSTIDNQHSITVEIQQSRRQSVHRYSSQRLVVDGYTYEIDQREDVEQWQRTLTASLVRRLVYADKPMTELEHVVPVSVSATILDSMNVQVALPKGDDDELRVFRTVLNVVSYDGNVPEVKCCIDLIHEVEGRGL